MPDNRVCKRCKGLRRPCRNEVTDGREDSIRDSLYPQFNEAQTITQQREARDTAAALEVLAATSDALAAVEKTLSCPPPQLDSGTLYPSLRPVYPQTSRSRGVSSSPERSSCVAAPSGSHAFPYAAESAHPDGPSGDAVSSMEVCARVDNSNCGQHDGWWIRKQSPGEVAVDGVAHHAASQIGTSAHPHVSASVDMPSLSQTPGHAEECHADNDISGDCDALTQHAPISSATRGTETVTSARPHRSPSPAMSSTHSEAFPGSETCADRIITLAPLQGEDIGMFMQPHDGAMLPLDLQGATVPALSRKAAATPENNENRATVSSPLTPVPGSPQDIVDVTRDGDIVGHGTPEEVKSVLGRRQRSPEADEARHDQPGREHNSRVVLCT